VAFDTAVVEALPFPDARFDVALSTLMLHHLPRVARLQCAIEMRRVLKPGGRALVVDFGPTERRGLMGHFHRHGHVDPREIASVLSDAGLRLTESGALGMRNLHFALASAP
jgi:ubiquinone/menaquinone biosynthesis C-methylase UbiE